MAETREQKFRRECEDLHENIEYGLYRDIDRILEEFPNEKYFYNDKRESAAAVALKHKEIKIYRLMMSKGLCLGPHEDAYKIISGFDDQIKQRIEEILGQINMKNTVEVADYISILISNSKVSHNIYESEISEMKHCIRKAFIDLDQITRIQPILKVVAYADKLSINFEFYDHKISNMDPTNTQNVRGCCYPTGRWEREILIGAKDLMRAGMEYLEALGTLAHELTHYAMQIVYQNNCKPYKWSQDNEESGRDEETSDEKRFSEICEACEENCRAEDSEPCIKAVFQYPKTQQHAELIVRVPQLLVLHRNDEAKLSRIESTYSKLFEFFEEKILVNIGSVLPRMKAIYKLNQTYQSKQQNIEQMKESWEEKFGRECENLHAKIEYGLDPDIDRILKMIPNEKHFYNDKKESAAAVALKHKQIKMYGLLISKGICLGPHEDANDITKRLDPRMKQIIREINKKNSTEVKKNSIGVADYISILISKSRISHNARECEVSEMEQCIGQAFNNLDQISQIWPILQVVAYAGKPSIIFDFYDDKISNMDPMKPKYVRGCCYPTGKWEGDIFIGAKGFMRAGTGYLEALGTLAHMLSHYAMQIVYQNNCKPYVPLDQDSEEISDKHRFNDICNQCEEICKAEDSEPCINVVFQYPEPERHAELIVRVPQLLVLHKNNEAKLSRIELTYSELFDFFEEKITPNIGSVLSRIKPIYKLDQAYQSKHQNIVHYVERKFIRLDANFEEVTENPLTEDELLDDTKNVKDVLLSDEPGAGKTTNLIAMAGKLKRRYPDHWTVVIDLKEFADCYKRDGDESTTFSTILSTISEIENYYCEKIFKFKNLDARNFGKLFEDDRVIFLMDGFDEISPSYKEFNLKLINAITRKSNNRIWISTRPHLEKELQGKLNCPVFRLKPFTIDDRRKFLELKWKFEVMDEETLNEKIQKVENVLNEIIEKSYRSDLTSNPLILTMISENLDDLNLYSIYETFVNKKKEIFLEKGPEAKKQIIDPGRWLNINAFHHEVALETVLDFGGSKDLNNFLPLLCGRTTLPSSEDVVRLGLMVNVENSNEIYKNFSFIHRTFAEYFVADFIIEGFAKFNIQEDYGTQELYSRTKDLKKTLGLFTDSKGVDTEKLFNYILEKYLLDAYSFYGLPMVKHFIYSFWKTRSHVDFLTDSSRNKKLQNFEKALNSRGRFFKNLFYDALLDGSDCFLKDVPKALEVKLRSFEFWKPWGVQEYSAMMLTARHSASFLLEFLKFIRKFLDPEILRKRFFDVDEQKKNILWHCSLETFNLILSDSPMIPLTRQEKEELLLAKNKNGLNVLRFYVTYKSKDEFKKYYEVVNDFDEKMPEIMLK